MEDVSMRIFAVLLVSISFGAACGDDGAGGAGAAGGAGGGGAGGGGADVCPDPILLTPPSGCDGPMFDEATMLADIEYLAAPELCGRVPGTPGDEATRALIAERFECLGVEVLDGLDSYDQPFIDMADRDTANVLGMIAGTDPDVGDEIIVVTAHPDHFGGGLLGANDNASGVAGMLAIAQALQSAGPLNRSVLLAAFNSEESVTDEGGLEGSAFFVSNPPSGVDVDKIVYVVNMDMLGEYSTHDKVEMIGTFPGTYAATALAGLDDNYPGLVVQYDEKSEGSKLSDNATFCEIGIPYVFAWTDGTCYHDVCDTANRIETAEMAAIAELLSELVIDLANTPTDLAAAVQDGDVCEM